MAYGDPHDLALSSLLISFTVTLLPDALKSLLLLQQDKFIPTPGPLHMLFPLTELFFSLYSGLTSNVTP